MTVEGNHLQRNTLGLAPQLLHNHKENTFQQNNHTASYQWAIDPFSRISYIPKFDMNFGQIQAPYPVTGRWSFFRHSIFFKFPWVDL